MCVCVRVIINMKKIPNAQTDFEQTLANKLLLCSHIEQEVIKIQYFRSPMIDLYRYLIILISCSRWTCSNHFYKSVCSKFICAISIISYLWSHTHTHTHIYIYIHTYIHIYYVLYMCRSTTLI